MKAMVFAAAGLILFLSFVTGQPAEKLKYGTPGRMVISAYLPMLAAEEKGMWEKNGLAVEWIPFKGTTALTQALAAGAVKVGADNPIALIPAMSRGLPGVLVATLVKTDQSGFFVLARSPVKEPKALKGLRIGVSSIGGVSYHRARFALASQGLDKEVRFVGVGGIPEGIAALKAGSIDATFTNLSAYINLILKGEVRVVAEFAQLVKEEWPGTSMIALKDFIQERPEVLGRVVRAMAETTNFLINNPPWAVEKIRSHAGFSQEAAEFVYRTNRFEADITINPKALENLRRALIEFGLISEKITPLVGELYTPRFTK